MEFGFEDTIPTVDEVPASQQLSIILKTFEDIGFSELRTYQTLDFHDEYDWMTDKDESNDEQDNIDNYQENQVLEIRNSFTLEECKR